MKPIPRNPIIKGSYALIPLTGGSYAKIDLDDIQRINTRKWQKLPTGYVYYMTKGKSMYMHRLVMQADSEHEVDHINFNHLDNRKINLRLCTRSQNACYRSKYKSKHSKYKGVCRNVRGLSGWQSKIRLNKKTIWLGIHKTQKEAALAYDSAAKKYHGEFAKVNFN